ncbi:MAG: F0F1 ATP synthase subunit delta [Gemmatimonadaceae bacterium]|nr:F0F1 ATP synthase subunit delta [Gemmatimonadaceae bacterium]
MRATTIARNYAEALLVLARKANDLDGWGLAIQGVVSAIESDARLRNFLAAPQVSAAQKNAVIGKAFTGKLPKDMVRFLQKVVMNRRQMLIPTIATEYGNLVDEATGRLHAQVTVSRETSDADRAMIAAQLSRAFAKTVVPHVSVNPVILGGVVVRVGDRVMDGSVRRRLKTLRARIVTGR